MRTPRRSAALLAGTAVLALGGASAAVAAPTHAAAPTTRTAATSPAYGGPIVRCPAKTGAYPVHPCTVNISVTIFLPGGGKITFQSYFFLPFEKGRVFFYSNTSASGKAAAPREVGTFTADAKGTVSGSVQLPAGVPAGSGSLVFEGDKGTQLTSPLTVAAPTATAPDKGSLPFTGADIAGLTVGGLVLVGAGGATVVAFRRRRATPAA